MELRIAKPRAIAALLCIKLPGTSLIHEFNPELLRPGSSDKSHATLSLLGNGDRCGYH
jgi:hypothetical protein